MNGSEKMSDVRNVIIIGSGPAGYTAGLYTARAMLEPLMFSGYASGGQLMLTSDVENFPGYPQGITGPEMMMHLREQAERFGCEVIDKNVASVDFSSRPFKVTVENEVFESHAIIVCTGAEAIWLNAENEEAQKGRIDNLIGRHEEVDELVHILARRKKNNVVLVGEPGTGKTRTRIYGLLGLKQDCME